MADLDPSHAAVKIKSMLSEAQPFYPPECCIYRVPLQIRNLNPHAYTPNVVSIGPFHYGDTRLQKMEGHKQIYCQQFIERSEASPYELVNRVQELEPKVRRCYSDEIKLSKEEFVNVILVDSGFVLEFFSRQHYDAVSSTPWLRSSIQEDLLLLENQLPFFVFEELYELAFPSRSDADDHHSFFRLSSHCFRHVNVPDFSRVANTGSNILHFTDMLRTSYLRPSDERTPTVAHVTQLYTATELQKGGVKFMVNKASDCLLDLDLSGRILRIPQIKVVDWTEIFLRNMVALEQCHYPRDSYITDYVAVLDFLINTDKDVEILVKNGIIVNWLGDNNKVAELFNGLCKNITRPQFNIKYSEICERLNTYYKHPFHSRMATLRRDYCNTPWKMLASIAGIILLILTVVQAVCSILQVK